MNDSRVIRGRNKFAGKRGDTPHMVEGRSHGSMQTDDFLEALTDTDTDPDVFFIRRRHPSVGIVHAWEA